MIARCAILFRSQSGRLSDKHDKFLDPKTETIHFPSLLIIRFLKGFSQSVMNPSDHPQPHEFDGRFHYIPVDHKGQYKGMARCSAEVATIQA